ncbi:MAG: hypothetical protein KKB50_16170 [Planctomycetes bacterium]|nr:hypothetical protein [Planctomycetota bacterium]
MPSADDNLKACEECGASIYPEMLDKHTAERWQDRLLCPHCLKEKKEAAPADQLPAATAPPAEEEAHAISLALEAEEDEPMDRPSRNITFGGGGLTFEQMGSAEDKHRRALLKGSPSATRCRIFHSKINDPSMLHMVQQINEWADQSEDIEIKFATSTIGVVEGKHADPHLIVTVFY